MTVVLSTVIFAFNLVTRGRVVLSGILEIILDDQRDGTHLSTCIFCNEYYSCGSTCIAAKERNDPNKNKKKRRKVCALFTGLALLWAYMVFR